MLKFIEHQSINKAWWDECVSRSSQHLIYGMSWYLDVISPGWCGLVDEEKGRYVLIIPLTVKKKLGISYLIQPILAQQLGIFSVDPNEEKSIHAINELKNKYLYINYNFNVQASALLPRTMFRKCVRQRTTYLLDLHPSYQQLLQNYAANHKRNIKKALRHGLTIKQSMDFESLVELFRKMKGLEISEIKNIHYEQLIGIYKASSLKDACILCSAVDKNNNVLASGFFLVFQKRVIYVLGASSEEGKEKGAMNLLIDEVIRDYSESEYVLDFEGGEAEGIGRFYRGFGGKPVNYATVEYNKLSFK